MSVFRTTRVTTWFTQLYLISHYSAIRAIWPLSLHPRSGFVLTLFWQIILSCLVVVSNCSHLTCSPFASAASNHKEGLPSARTRRWNSAARSHPLYEDIHCVGGGQPFCGPLCVSLCALCHVFWRPHQTAKLFNWREKKHLEFLALSPSAGV